MLRCGGSLASSAATRCECARARYAQSRCSGRRCSESTYCGFDTGTHAGKQIGLQDLKGVGEQLCRVMLELLESATLAAA